MLFSFSFCSFFLHFSTCSNKCCMEKTTHSVCMHASHSCPYVSIKLFSLSKRSLRTEELCRGLNACVGVPTLYAYVLLLLLLLLLLTHRNIIQHTIYVCYARLFASKLNVEKCIQKINTTECAHTHMQTRTDVIGSETPCAFHLKM